MGTRYTYIARHRARGAVRPVAIAIVAIVAALAASSWFLIVRPYRQQMQLDAGGAPSVPASGKAAPAEAAPANLQALDVNQLLNEASKALKAQRYLSPAGNNAFEFYLRVLAKQPDNPVATSALRETFPFAASDAEQAVNSRNFDEAQREIDLLAKADPANYTLTILRSKLDAQRKLANQQEQQAQDQQKAAQLAAQKAATEKQEAAKQAEQLQAQQALAAEQAKTRQQKPAEQPQQAAQPQAQAASADTAGAQDSSAVLLKAVQARYPTAALRTGQGGWVLVGFTVTTDGTTSNVHVIDAQPRHVFDRAATEAIDHYRFKPAMRDGNPVESTSQQKIEFSTGR
ncbi:energy transducer TonB [Rhodanobacter sp. DHB23]|uniref:energy transducer TonB n=1 Tax=Rhodanobacter sp. DHB23 TaxID=2775923 RepID=UPI00177AC741|nr:energy transducer TonB [Rhodanobacter sp. DHB23]MBD8873260.1 energy transducer TonB [Rhodanobacter sp. DHB23]